MRNSKEQFIQGTETRIRTGVYISCGICGKEFYAQQNQIKNGKGKFCSIFCKRKMKFSTESRKKMSLSRMGKVSPMKGKTFSEDWKKKLSLAKMNKKRPDLSGSNHPQWKGGITPINLAIRGSLEYKIWRRAVFERDNYACIFCGANNKNGNRTTLNADHIKPFSLFPELRFAIDNGRTLCVACHRKTPTYAKKVPR